MAGIYIHIPFCKKKCIYCNFYSIVRTKQMEEYVDAVCKEVSGVRYAVCGTINTIYFGGGTPTLLPVHSLETILNALYENFEVSSEVECTIEGNPEQLSLEYLTDLRKVGFNRISIGIQSFNDDILQFLGRIHTAKDALLAVENAQKAGFDNISADLIYGIFMRSLQDWTQELKTVFNLPVKHLSAYSLTVEENTMLFHKVFRQKSVKVDEDQSVQEMKLLMEEAKKNHFEHYEVSNFALKDYCSKHNTNYWNGTPYLGFGAAAHSFSGTERRWNISNVDKYIHAIQNNEHCFEAERLSPTDLYNEYIMLRLRTKDGIDLKHFEDCFGIESRVELFKTLQKINPNYYTKKAGFICITEAGLSLLDFVTSELMRG